MPMHTSFFLVAMLMTVVALALAPLLRERLMVERRGEDGSGTLPHATRYIFASSINVAFRVRLRTSVYATAAGSLS